MNVQEVLAGIDLLEQRLALLNAMRSWLAEQDEIFYGSSTGTVTHEVKLQVDEELKELARQVEVSRDQILQFEVRQEDES